MTAEQTVQTDMGRIFAWDLAQGLVPCTPEDDGLLAADSWLVTDGCVRSLDHHRQRFFRACTEAAHLAQTQLFAFWENVIRTLPRRGDWFPRVELSAGQPPVLRLRIRPAPPRGASIRLQIWDAPDPRTTPRRKGPDLARLAEVRRRASTAGADDALLTTESGLVLEAATASVLWWEGACLCRPSPELDVLPGVTSQLIAEIATRHRVRVEYRRQHVSALDGCEVWLANALHGIRPVSCWVGTALMAGPAVRAPQWQARLEACSEPLSEYAETMIGRNSSRRHVRNSPDASGSMP